MGHISVIGSCNMDLMIEADRRPQAGETVMGKRLIVSPGGKGANQAVAAARLGEKAYMIGCVGNDAYGSMMLDTLKEIRIMCLSWIMKRPARRTSFWQKAITALSY